MTSKNKNLLYKIAIFLGILMIADALALIIFHRNINFGTIIPGSIGIIFVLTSIIKLYIKPSEAIIKNKIMRTLIFISISGLILSFIVIETIIVTYSYPDKVDNPDYVMVLGGGLKGEELSATLLERMKKAVEFLKENKNIKVIVSGGQGMGESISEAEAMKRYLMNNGIAEEQIITENKSTSTMENFKFTKEVLIKRGETGNRLLIVTSDSHMFRARFLAKRNGFVPFGLPSKTPLSTLPNNYIREYLAVIKSTIFDRV